MKGEKKKSSEEQMELRNKRLDIIQMEKFVPKG